VFSGTESVKKARSGAAEKKKRKVERQGAKWKKLFRPAQDGRPDVNPACGYKRKVNSNAQNGFNQT